MVEKMKSLRILEQFPDKVSKFKVQQLLERCKVVPEEFVVIFGAGPLGLCALQMCKAVGASKVVVSHLMKTTDLLPGRLE